MLHWYNLHWYGPGSLAAFLTGSGSIATDMRGEAAVSASLTGTGTVVTYGQTGKRMVADLEGVGSVATDLRGTAQLDATISIGARPSAEDIAQAVWGASQTINTEAGTMARAMKIMNAVLANRVVTDPVAGTFRVYDDDDTTVLVEGDLWQDVAGTTPYDGTAGAERRDRLT